MSARWIIAAVIGVVIARFGVARADRPLGFDHVGHDGKVAVSGGAPIACASCHQVTVDGKLSGRPDHAGCFGACHGPAPAKGDRPTDDTAQLCTSCHAPDTFSTRRPTVSYPPYRIDTDFGLQFEHARHQAAACTSCHVVPGAAAATPRPHQRCLGCHVRPGSGPTMADCQACHPAGSGKNLRPALVPGALAIGGGYDHRRHQARQGNVPALACAGCHRTLATTAALELPTPTVATCGVAGCHDGAASFAPTASCTRCHTRAPSEPFVAARPITRFSHAGHDARAPLPACGACHALAGDGAATSTGHGACATCHADDLGTRTPKICGACHLASEPWRKLTADQLPAPRSEFGVELSHAAHAAVACERCHQLDTATRELRPPRGHGACADATCHRASAGPSPLLTDCAGCHGRDREAARDRDRLAAPWSVRARFRHQPHRGPDVACVDCHRDVAAATTIAGIAGPPKATCAGCHDGVRGFRLTGHGCARCHGN